MYIAQTVNYLSFNTGKLQVFLFRLECVTDMLRKRFAPLEVQNAVAALDELKLLLKENILKWINEARAISVH